MCLKSHQQYNRIVKQQKQVLYLIKNKNQIYSKC